MVEQSTVMIEEREKEIRSIVQSISEINEMYRDLATMIVDQVRERWVWAKVVHRAKLLHVLQQNQYYSLVHTYMNTLASFPGPCPAPVAKLVHRAMHYYSLYFSAYIHE